MLAIPSSRFSFLMRVLITGVKPCWHSYEHVEKGHGRLEKRQLLSTPDLNDYLDREWGEIGQVFRLQRERTTPEKCSVEVVYGLTTLSREPCSAQRLFHLIPNPCAIKN